MEEQVEVQAPPIRPQPASLLQRFAGFAFDYVVISIIYVYLPSSIRTGDVMSHLGFLIIALIYYLVFEWRLHKTPGKILTGTIVRQIDGSRPTTEQIGARTVHRFVPWDPFTVFREDRFMLHDRRSFTSVERTGLLQRCKLKTVIAAWLYGPICLLFAVIEFRAADGCVWLAAAFLAAGVMWIAVLERPLWAWRGLIASSAAISVVLLLRMVLDFDEIDPFWVSVFIAVIGIVPLWIVLTDRPGRKTRETGEPDEVYERLMRER